MSTKAVALIAGVAGLIVSFAILTLMAFGVSGVLHGHSVDWMYLLWPSSLMLVVGWRTTILGITITAVSIITNCLLYSFIAVLLWTGIRFVSGLLQGRQANRSPSLPQY